jgi:hypothetical protein
MPLPTVFVTKSKTGISGPLFKWFGSKWNASKYYPTPAHSCIVEPFAGSACYALRHSNRQVIIAEANEQVRHLWDWLINHATESAIRDIPCDLPIGLDLRELGMSYGQTLLVKMWQRTNNVGNCWTVSPWGNKPGQWTPNARARVAEEHHLIRHWKVHSCGITLLRTIQGNDITWFIDPPYEHNYQYRLPLSLSYSQFGKLVQGVSGEIIACEAKCPKTGAVPNYLPFQEFRETVTSRRKSHQSHHSKELLYHRL